MQNDLGSSSTTVKGYSHYLIIPPNSEHKILIFSFIISTGIYLPFFPVKFLLSFFCNCYLYFSAHALTFIPFIMHTVVTTLLCFHYFFYLFIFFCLFSAPCTSISTALICCYSAYSSLSWLGCDAFSCSSCIHLSHISVTFKVTSSLWICHGKKYISSRIYMKS